MSLALARLAVTSCIFFSSSTSSEATSRDYFSVFSKLKEKMNEDDWLWDLQESQNLSKEILESHRETRPPWLALGWNEDEDADRMQSNDKNIIKKKHNNMQLYLKKNTPDNEYIV